MPYIPGRTSRDQVRALVGDTSDPPILAGGDLAYDAALTTAGGVVTRAAITVAQNLIAQLSMEPTAESAEGVSVDYSTRIPALQALIRRLEAEADTATPAGGPISGVAAVEVRW